MNTEDWSWPEELERHVRQAECMSPRCRRRRQALVIGDPTPGSVTVYASCTRHLPDVWPLMGCDPGCGGHPDAVCRDVAHVVEHLVDAVNEGFGIELPDAGDWSQRWVFMPAGLLA